jgi:hypothetical protein
MPPKMVNQLKFGLSNMRVIFKQDAQGELD